MSAGEYFAWVLGGLALGLVCLMGAMFLGSLARQAWRDVGAWRKGRQAKRHELRSSRHLIREVRRGRMGL